MKRVFLFLLFACLPGMNVRGADVSVDINQGYIWRGMTFNDGLVLQPALDVSSESGFGINVWGNMDIDDYNGALEAGEISEVDITLSYSYEIKGFALTAGVIEYLYVHQSTEDMGALPGTREVYISLSRELGRGVSAGAAVYYDCDEVDDYYAMLSLGYSVSLNDETELELSGSLGHIGKDMSRGGKEGLNDCTVSTKVIFAVSDAFSVKGTIGYTDSLDDEVLPDQDVNLFGGISLLYSL